MVDAGAMVKAGLMAGRKNAASPHPDGDLSSGESRIPPPNVRRNIRRRILTWYAKNARDLPWRRRAGDGYAQWVAEIMLQQTQVKTVIPYYNRFMQSFPTVKRLAAATDDELLHHWQGLGYYRRAANLHKAAKQLADAKIDLPRDPVNLRKLPGIGQYTAGAIASIAFNHPAPAVDGNITRVYARLFHITGDVTRPDTRRHIQNLAAAMIPTKIPGHYNQALMDIGATICVPANPLCTVCPLSNYCQANIHGDAGELPIKATRKSVTTQHVITTVIQHQNHLLVRKRPSTGLWAGLWEPPNVEISVTDAKDDAGKVPHLDTLLREYNISSNIIPQHIGRIPHLLTHRQYHFDVYKVQLFCRVRNTPDNNHQWIAQEYIHTLAISTATRKIFSLFTGE